MSMLTHIYGFRPPDAKWKKMKAAFDACEAAETEVPQSVWAFFNHETPSEAGVAVSIGPAISPICEDGVDGFEVDLTKLPKDVTKLRFVNSY